jgi:retinol dehydrogenase-12
MARSLQKESMLVRWTTPIASLFCVPVSIGIKNHLWAATSSSVVSGTYYEPVGIPGTRSDAANDELLSRKLREWTEGVFSGFKSLE